MATATTVSRSLEATETLRNQTASESSRRILLFAVAAAFTIRFVVVLLTFRGLTDPARHFDSFGNEVGWIARSLAQGHGFSSPFWPQSGPTALLPPLYPFLLAGIFKLFGVYSAASAFIILTLNSLFSALTCIPIYLATRLSFPKLADRRVAVFAAWAWAIYPFAIYFSAGRVWEFSLTSLLITTCFYLALTLHRRPTAARWLAFGALYGLAGLSNPAVFSLFPALLLLPLWKLWKATQAHGASFFGVPLRNAVLVSVGLLAVLTPWTIRNYLTMHVICPVRDAFGYEFWSANNGDGSNPTLEWTHPASNPDEMTLYLAQGETAYIAAKQAVGYAYVLHHPGAFATLTLRRAVNYWTGFWSLDPAYTRQEPTQLPNVFFCSSLTLLMLFGLATWWRRDRIASLAYILPVAIFPIAYYLSHPLMDYRQPIEPEIVVLVVLGLREARARLKSRSRARIAILEPTLNHSFDDGLPSFAELSTSASTGDPTPTAG